MKLRALAAAVLFALLVGARPGRAATANAGAQPFDFLFLDANARPVGMGGAYTALASDENALLYNPAGLGFIRRYRATFMHDQYVAGLMQEYAAFVAPQGWGASLNMLNSGAIAQSTLSNPNGTGLGATSLSDMALSAGYGRTLGQSLSLGLGMKYIHENIADVAATDFAFDIGALYASPDIRGLTFGAALQNMGPKVKFQGPAEDLPLNLRMGAGYAFDAKGTKDTLSFDLTQQSGQGVLFAAGGEIVLAKVLSLRLGFSSRNNAGLGLTAGAGWSWKDASLDYGFAPYGDLGVAQRASLTLRWGEERVPGKRLAPVLLKAEPTAVSVSTSAAVAVAVSSQAVVSVSTSAAVVVSAEAAVSFSTSAVSSETILVSSAAAAPAAPAAQPPAPPAVSTPPAPAPAPPPAAAAHPVSAKRPVRANRTMSAARVEHRQPQGQVGAFQAGSEAYCWAWIIMDHPPAKISFVWYVNGREVHRYTAAVKLKAARWWAVDHVYPGAWRVEIVSESGATIGSTKFVVKPKPRP